MIARATYQGTLRFSVPHDFLSKLTGLVLVAYALAGYPAVALAAGQSYPGLPTFGVPCPTVIFTLGLLAWSPRPAWSLLFIPISWSLIGISAAVQLGVLEDWGLPIAALAWLCFASGVAGRCLALPGNFTRQLAQGVLYEGPRSHDLRTVCRAAH